MKSTLIFETKRIFIFKHTNLFLAFFFLAISLVYFGTAKYRTFVDEKEAFLNYENLRVNQYVNYEQYGFQGFRVLWLPSPLVVFHHSSLATLEGIIDTKDTVAVSSVHKGRRIFTSKGLVTDFSTLFFVLGSLLMMYFGLKTFVSIEAIRFHNSKMTLFHTIGSRMIILTGYFSVVIIVAYFFAKILGVPIDAQDTRVFFLYAVYVILLLDFFYCVGIGYAVLTKFKKGLGASAYLLWFIIIFAIPLLYDMDLEKQATQIESNESVNIKKIANGMKFERDAKTYFKNLQGKKPDEIRHIAKQFAATFARDVMPLNAALEKKLNGEVKQVLHHYEKYSVMSPSSFYSFLAKESSGMGYYGYQDFFNNLQVQKKDFYHFYFSKRFNHVDPPVESFVKNNENIFVSHGVVPASYLKGMFFILLYCVLFLGVALFLLFRQLKKSLPEKSVEVDIEGMEIGKTYFYLVTDPEQKRGIFQYLKTLNAIIIPKPDAGLYDPGISLQAWMHFEAALKGVSLEKMLPILNTLTVTQEQLSQKIKNLDNEVFMKVYLALHLAQDSNIYVFDDFLNQMTRKFEQEFKETIDQHIPAAIIIYCSQQMYDVTVKGMFQNPSGDCRFVAIDLNLVSLR